MASSKDHDLRLSGGISSVLSTGKSFLDLPKNIREDIYLKSGILTPSHPQICLLDPREQILKWNHNHISVRDVLNSQHRSSYWHHNLINVRNLLLVSKLVSKEVESLFFRRAGFTTPFGCPVHCLQGLKSLSDNALSSLRHLTIKLRIAYREDSIWEGVQCRCLDETTRRKKPLSTAYEQDRQLILEWNAAIARLASNASKSLHLEIYCDTDDIVTAREFIQPLKQMPNIEGGFSIRLADRRHKPLLKLAEETLLRMMGKSPPQQSFHAFNMLPKELRMRILSFTDLVSPVTINWHRETGLTTRGHNGRGTGPGGYKYHYPNMCNKRRSVASTLCDCHSDTTPFFLVSRQMYHEAKEVFYNQNTFFAAPQDWIQSGSEVELFFKSRSDTALNHLKSIKVILFDFFFESTKIRLDRLCKEWEGAIKLYAERVTNQNLEVLILFPSDDRSYAFQYDHIDQVPENAWSLEPYRDQIEQVVRTFERFDGVRKIGAEIVWEKPYFDEDELDPEDPAVGRTRAHEKSNLWEAEVARITKHLKDTVLRSKYTDKVVELDESGEYLYFPDPEEQ